MYVEVRVEAAVAVTLRLALPYTNNDVKFKSTRK